MSRKWVYDLNTGGPTGPPPLGFNKHLVDVCCSIRYTTIIYHFMFSYLGTTQWHRYRRDASCAKHIGSKETGIWLWGFMWRIISFFSDELNVIIACKWYCDCTCERIDANRSYDVDEWVFHQYFQYHDHSHGDCESSESHFQHQRRYINKWIPLLPGMTKHGNPTILHFYSICFPRWWENWFDPSQNALRRK